MKGVSRVQIRNHAKSVRSQLEWGRKAVLVWWSIRDEEFLVVRSQGYAGRLLTARMDDGNLACYVGIFEPSATYAEVREALEAHTEGHLA